MPRADYQWIARLHGSDSLLNSPEHIFSHRDPCSIEPTVNTTSWSSFFQKVVESIDELAKLGIFECSTKPSTTAALTPSTAASAPTTTTTTTTFTTHTTTSPRTTTTISGVQWIGLLLLLSIRNGGYFAIIFGFITTFAGNSCSTVTTHSSSSSSLLLIGVVFKPLEFEKLPWQHPHLEVDVRAYVQLRRRTPEGDYERI
mmetsp:Transcript_36809/g.71372  ORF Transcript_36809/g.71372 Transcript_36809/m.71372 type:complete len:200 (+) Transcript_36809:556-1155(+)